MGHKPKADQTSTYVMDTAVMEEMENLEATAVLLGYSEDKPEWPTEPLETDADQEIEETNQLIQPKD